MIFNLCLKIDVLSTNDVGNSAGLGNGDIVAKDIEAKKY